MTDKKTDKWRLDIREENYLIRKLSKMKWTIGKRNFCRYNINFKKSENSAYSKVWGLIILMKISIMWRMKKNYLKLLKY